MRKLVLMVGFIFFMVQYFNAQELRNNEQRLLERVSYFATENQLSEKQKNALFEAVQQNRKEMQERRLTNSERPTEEERAAFRVSARNRVYEALEQDDQLVQAWYAFQREQRQTIQRERQERRLEKNSK
jgi:hypothetical protein